MDSRNTLEIARGAREVARARGSRNPSNGIPATTNRFSNSNPPSKERRSRVMGHVGVAVRRDKANRPMPTHDNLFDQGDGNDDDDDGAEVTYTPSVDENQGSLQAPLHGLRQSNDLRFSPALARPMPNNADGGTAIDLTEDDPRPADCESTSFAAFDDPSDTQEAGSSPAVERQSLASLLLPVPSPEVATAKGKKRRRQQQPLPEADGSEVPHSSSGRGKRRTWAATFSQERTEGSRPGGALGTRGDGTLSAWLEPPSSPTRRKSRTGWKEDASVDSAALGYGSSGLVGYEQDDTSGDESDSGKWMSDRLEGLDPSGAARAKDSWTDRERRNLTCTDIALGAKRKSRGGRSMGWKTKAGGSKVFIETGGGVVVASGRAAYRKSKRGGARGGGARKKRKG